jgi:hypothetical protein
MNVCVQSSQNFLKLNKPGAYLEGVAGLSAVCRMLNAGRHSFSTILVLTD